MSSKTIIPQEFSAFNNSDALGAWLSENGTTQSELWIRIFKGDSGHSSVTWAECVIESIRFGWIDGQKKPFDEKSFLQRITPRKPGSSWSAKNRQHATLLIEERRMTPTGMLHVEAARADGRWTSAYEGQAKMAIPQDFLDALNDRPRAKEFFGTLDRKNLYSIYYRLQTAKRPETRAKRMAQMLDQLDRGERFH